MRISHCSCRCIQRFFCGAYMHLQGVPISCGPFLSFFTPMLCIGWFLISGKNNCSVHARDHLCAVWRAFPIKRSLRHWNTLCALQQNVFAAKSSWWCTSGVTAQQMYHAHCRSLIASPVLAWNHSERVHFTVSAALIVIYAIIIRSFRLMSVILSSCSVIVSCCSLWLCCIWLETNGLFETSDINKWLCPILCAPFVDFGSRHSLSLSPR